MTDCYVNKTLALKQWNQMRSLLSVFGLNVKIIEQNSALPDMVFVANAGMVYKNNFILSNFKYKQRRKEGLHFKNWFLKEGYNIVTVPKRLSFEGCGDAIVHDDNLIAGYGLRTDLGALKYIANKLELNLIYLKLLDERFYHLNTCFSIIDNNLAIYNPNAFSKHTIKKLSNFELLPVTIEEANNFACNSIVFNKTILMPSDNDRIADILSGRGYQVYQIDTSEFLKSGGSLRCMCLCI
jgi:N-dimethylarginine dimethylaminohydrolase